MQSVSKLVALATVSVGMAVAGSSSAGAWGWDPTRAPEQPRLERVINHYVYKPRYVHVYHTVPQADPYSYRYARRAYYPYYGSRYWVAAEQMRYRYRYHWTGPKYVYQPSWGRPRHDVVSTKPVHTYKPTK